MSARSAAALRDADPGFALRPATLDDVDGIVAIENASFRVPWTKEAMIQEIGSRSWSRVVTAVRGDEVAGFMVYWIVASEAHLLNLAVHPEWRRHGMGRAMVRHMIDACRSEGRTDLILEVRASNGAAQSLYLGLGFEVLGVRAGYYSDNGEDALVMLCRLMDPPGAPGLG